MMWEGEEEAKARSGCETATRGDRVSQGLDVVGKKETGQLQLVKGEWQYVIPLCS